MVVNTDWQACFRGHADVRSNANKEDQREVCKTHCWTVNDIMC